MSPERSVTYVSGPDIGTSGGESGILSCPLLQPLSFQGDTGNCSPYQHLPFITRATYATQETLINHNCLPYGMDGMDCCSKRNIGRFEIAAIHFARPRPCPFPMITATFTVSDLGSHFPNATRLEGLPNPQIVPSSGTRDSWSYEQMSPKLECLTFVSSP